MGRRLAPRVATPIALAFMLALVAGQTALAWRHFPMLLGDQGWYLQVALRLSQGVTLYRDVAWAYGPLPAQTLAALFRWLGAEAGWATLLNAGLATLSVLLTYAATRALIEQGAALIFTGFAAFVGVYVGGDLVSQHLYTYTQAAAWGMTLSLAALVAVLQWPRRGGRWLLLSGVCAGLAFLSKPEFGVIAIVPAALLVALKRGGWQMWATLVGACALVALGGLGAQALSAGWQATWRGYTGYDLLSEGRFWGGGLGSLRWLGSIACFWGAAALIGFGLIGRMRRTIALGGAAIMLAFAVWLIAPLLISSGPNPIPATLARLLQWLAAAPWGILTPVLLFAAWPGWRRSAPPVWWALWLFALLANARLALTGYASALACAPALAVLWWLVCDRVTRARGRRAAMGFLAALAVIGIISRILLPPFTPPSQRRALPSAVGRVSVDATQVDGIITPVLAQIEQSTSPGAPIFATGWGAGWYLLTQRPNASAFDVVLDGLGTNEPERTRLLFDLSVDPPAVLLMPVEHAQPIPAGATAARYADAAAVQASLGAWQQQHYANVTLPGNGMWAILTPR